MLSFGYCTRCTMLLEETTATVTDDNVDNDGLLAILLFELLYDNLLEVGSEFISYEVDGATTEATTHDAATSYIALLGNFVEEVEFFAAYLIFLAEAVVGLIHHLADCFVVVLLESFANVEHANNFADDVAGTLVFVLSNLSLNLFEHVVVRVAEAFNFGMEGLDNLSYVLALETTLVVGRTGEFVLYAAVDEDELVALGVPGEILIFAAAAVETEEAALLTENGDGLVHDTAVAADVLVLGALTYAGKFHLLNLVFAPKIVESERIGAFESCRRAHTSAEGYITSKSGVEAFNGYTESHHFTANTVDVACPAGLGTLLVVERELYAVLEVDGVCVNNTGAVGLDFCNHTLLDSAGEYETVIIVGVLTNEVDATGRCIYVTSGAVEVLDETAANVFDCKFHSCIVL